MYLDAWKSWEIMSACRQAVNSVTSCVWGWVIMAAVAVHGVPHRYSPGSASDSALRWAQAVLTNRAHGTSTPQLQNPQLIRWDWEVSHSIAASALAFGIWKPTSPFTGRERGPNTSQPSHSQLIARLS
jgi:hypothetical protein